MKKLILFLLFALPFFVQAQTIDATFKNFSEGDPFNTETKLKLQNIEVGAIDKGFEIKAETVEEMPLAIRLSSTAAGKYTLALYNNEEESIESGKAAVFFRGFISGYIPSGETALSAEEKAICKENNVSTESYLQITKSVNGKISGNFVLMLDNRDCSYFMIDCVGVLKGSFTDIQVP